MNGYDFDKTILKGNSVRRFYMFCAVRLPYLWLLLPELLLAVILYGLRIVKKEGFLRMLEVFIALVPNRNKYVQKFWDKNLKHIYAWYREVHRDDDLIISASPDFIIGAACDRLGVRHIASPNNKQGRVLQGHCYSARKVDAYRAHFGDTPLETFYSDSFSDTPMFKLARRGYLVKKGKITLVYENGQPVAPAAK